MMKCLFHDPAQEAKSPATLTVQEKPVPELKEGEVLMRVVASSVNRLDTMQANGKYPVPAGVTLIGGLDSSGYLVDAKTLEPTEDKKMYAALLSGGAYAEYAAVVKDHLMPLDGMTDLEGGALSEVWITAYQLLKFILQVEENKGKTALVYAAASGVGTSIIQLCKMFGVKTIAIASTAEKLEFCEKLGCEFSINYKEHQKEAFVQKVMEFTQNKGIDYILDPIGGQNFHQNIECIATDCKWVVYGFLGGATFDCADGKFNLGLLMRKRASLLTTTLRARSTEYKTELISSFVNRCMDKFKTGDLKVIIHKEFNYSQIAEAMAIVEGNQAIGKVVLKNDL